MDSITTLIVEDEPMLAEILVDTIKQFPQFEVIGIADKLESAKKLLRLYQPQLTLPPRRQHALSRAYHFHHRR